MENPLRDSELPYKIDFLTIPCEDFENDDVSEVSLDDCLRNQDEEDDKCTTLERHLCVGGSLWVETFNNEIYFHTLMRASGVPETQDRPSGSIVDYPLVEIQEWGVILTPPEEDAHWSSVEGVIKGRWPSTDEDLSPSKRKRLLRGKSEGCLICEDTLSTEEQSTEVQVIMLPGYKNCRFSRSHEI